MVLLNERRREIAGKIRVWIMCEPRRLTNQWVSKDCFRDSFAKETNERRDNTEVEKKERRHLFFLIPFYLQSVLVHSTNCVKTCIQWHVEECSVALICN
jgi:hypothetical protein